MDPFFVESLDLREHPIKKAKKKIRTEHCLALTYLVKQVVGQTKEKKDILQRLEMYQKTLFPDIKIRNLNQYANLSEIYDCLGNSRKKRYRKKYRLMLICDVSLILQDNALITQVVMVIKHGLSTGEQKEIERVLMFLFNGIAAEQKYSIVEPLIKQYCLNKTFLLQHEYRIIVTANMSAGKSTLINALIGKNIAKTSQEACTGNICYLYNRAFEDGSVHLLAKKITMNATFDELHGYGWNEPIAIASYFAHSTPQIPRVCLIDTPGVNAALHKEHAELAHSALLYENYDIVLYVICPTNLGTDAEMKHLQWVAKKLRGKKIIFVLNKLDNYRECSDSIEDSIKKLKEDLVKLDFKNPVICPISAYFSYLIKLKMTGQIMSDDEVDEYTYMSKKFWRPSYDLSCYYNDIKISDEEPEEIKLSKRAGLYGFEKIIYGG